jgi:hypothetical protein
MANPTTAPRELTLHHPDYTGWWAWVDPAGTLHDGYTSAREAREHARESHAGAKFTKGAGWPS